MQVDSGMCLYRLTLKDGRLCILCKALGYLREALGNKTLVRDQVGEVST